MYIYIYIYIIVHVYLYIYLYVYIYIYTQANAEPSPPGKDIHFRTAPFRHFPKPPAREKTRFQGVIQQT